MAYIINRSFLVLTNFSFHYVTLLIRYTIFGNLIPSVNILDSFFIHPFIPQPNPHSFAPTTAEMKTFEVMTLPLKTDFLKNFLISPVRAIPRHISQ